MTETARTDVAIVDGPIQMRRRKLMMPPAPSISIIHPANVPNEPRAVAT
jgi:hypothetical protein